MFFCYFLAILLHYKNKFSTYFMRCIPLLYCVSSYCNKLFLLPLLLF